MKAWISASILVAVLAAGTGCGSQEQDSSDTGAGSGFTVQASTTMLTAALSRSQFIARVNRICREGWPVIVENLSQYSATQDPTESRKARLADAVRVSITASIDIRIFDSIRLVGAPKGQERKIEKIIGSMQEAVERAQRVRPIYSYAELTALFSDYNRRARGYGLHECVVDKAHIERGQSFGPAGRDAGT